MLSLNTHIPIEFIKKSKRLQEVECEKWWVIEKNKYLSIWKFKPTKFISLDYVLPAPTIADIIDNAEMLFGKEKKCMYSDDTYGGYREMGEDILEMCQQDKSIEEISEYILKSIK